MRSLQRLIAASALLLPVACSTATVQPIGRSHPPLNPGTEVIIYTTERQVGRPFEVVAIITYVNRGKFQLLDVTDSYPELKQKARDVGANAVIVDSSYSIVSGAISRGVSVGARAIYVADPTRTAPNAAPGQTISPMPGDAGTQPNDPAQVLRELRKRHADGLLSDQEYEQKAQEALRQK